MRVQLFVGDLLKVPADAVCTSTNPWLSLQAGTGGAVRLFGGHAIQEACDERLAAELTRTGRRHLAPGTAHLTPAGRLAFRGVVHCVAIDAFHGSSEEIIGSCVSAALALAEREGFARLALPAFATGNGRFPLDRSLRAMRAALRAHRGPTVEVVSIAVADLARADAARGILSEEGLLEVASERDGQLHGWVSALYRHLLHGGLPPAGEALADAQRAVAEADESGLRLLLWDGNWRPRLVAAWLAGVVGTERLLPLIAELLLESEVSFAGQGYCFALTRFGTPSAARALERYLERWLPRTDCAYDQDWALAALTIVDEARAARQLDAWARFVGAHGEGDPSATLQAARERLQGMIEFADEHLARSRRAPEGPRSEHLCRLRGRVRGRGRPAGTRRHHGARRRLGRPAHVPGTVRPEPPRPSVAAGTHVALGDG